MKINLHKNARTTPAQRAFIQNEDQANVSELADRFGVSETTIRRWKKRNFVFDKPHTPKRVKTALTPEQEMLVILLRICLHFGLDDLLKVVQQFIFPTCSRSSLNRLLKRYEISRLSHFKKVSTREQAARLDDYRGTFFYYNTVTFPRLPGTLAPFHVQTLLDCSFRYFYADICMNAHQPPLFFIKQALHHFPLKVLGLIFTDPIVLFEPSMTIPESTLRHNQLIKNYCQINNLVPMYLKTIPEPTIDRLKQELQARTKEKGKDKPFPFFNNEIILENIYTYNTRMNLKTLKHRTPCQAILKYYTQFPNSFKKNPNQSFGTSLPPGMVDRKLASFLYIN